MKKVNIDSNSKLCNTPLKNCVTGLKIEVFKKGQKVPKALKNKEKMDTSKDVHLAT